MRIGFIFVSDGVTDNLTHDEMRDILSTYLNNKQAVEELNGNAFQRSKSPSHLRSKADDITAVVVQVGKGQAERLEPSPDESEDNFSWWSMNQALRKDAYYVKVDFAGGIEGEEYYIAEVNRLKDEVSFTNVRELKNCEYYSTVTRDELIRLRDGTS